MHGDLPNGDLRVGAPPALRSVVRSRARRLQEVQSTNQDAVAILKKHHKLNAELYAHARAHATEAP